MELETLNKLYCELSQVVTAKSAREISLEKTADARAAFLEVLYKKYNIEFDAYDRKTLAALLAEWKPENYARY